MKKATIYILLLVILLCVIIFGIYSNSNKKENDSYNDKLCLEVYENHQDDVDTGTQELMKSQEYKEMSEVEQIEIIGNLLGLYETSGAIKNLYYDSNDKLYSFMYENGALGGVSLKPFDPMLN